MPSRISVQPASSFLSTAGRRRFYLMAAAVLGFGIAPSANAQVNPYAARTTVNRTPVSTGNPLPTKPESERNWAEKMFSELSHDFGTVARGADVRHEIVVTNPYEEVVRITGVEKTCGCTQAEISKNELKTHETATIKVAMDTRKFTHEKNSNVIVGLAFTDKQGRYTSASVRVPIRAYIRTDVVVQPGAANFGAVEAGVGSDQVLTIDYAGRPDWRIEGVASGNPHVETTLSEATRTPTGVRYQLRVSLKEEAPIGTVRDRLVLSTNDGPGQTVPVLVEANVEPDIVVTPGRVALGRLRAGQTKTVNVVVRGRRPFEIDEVACNEHEDCFTVRLAPGVKPVHVVPLTVKAPAESGRLVETFEILIAGRDEPVTFEAYGEIVN